MVSVYPCGMVRPLILSVFVVAACQSNPVFMISTGGNEGGSTGAADTTSASAGETTSRPTTSGEAEATTDRPDTTGTTGAVDPSTTTGHTATSDATTTPGSSEGSSGGESSTSSSGGESSTASSGESTTGEESTTGGEACALMDTALYLKLYPLCDAIATQWIGGSGDGYMVDCGSVLKPAKVLPHDKAVAAFNVEVCEVLELVPSNELGGRIEGRFGELALAPDEQGNAELLTVVTCATNQPAGSCDVEVSMWVSTMEMQIIMNKSVQLANGQYKLLAIPLYAIAGINQGDEFAAHFKVTVGGAASEEDRVFLISPRIRKSGG